MPIQPPDWESRHTGQSYPTITQYDRKHLSILVLFIFLCGILVMAVKKLPGSVVKASRKVASAIMLLISTVYFVWVLSPSRIVWDETAPFHVTDLLRYITPLALGTENPTATALSYYWGFFLNPMAIFFPDMAYVQDNWRLQELGYWYFHLAATIVPVVLTFGLGYRPSWKDWRVVSGITMAWAGVSGVVNKLTGGNYFFSAGHPRGWSPLHWFGPWPWYLLICVPGVPVVFSLMTIAWPGNRRAFRRAR
ncbi:TIGR02206 family membrane protein [Corynebacterium sp. CCUG 59401]|nr:TIGR02206 family membrane protein [Corynebacterium pseudogenitalium]